MICDNCGQDILIGWIHSPDPYHSGYCIWRRDYNPPKNIDEIVEELIGPFDGEIEKPPLPVIEAGDPVRMIIGGREWAGIVMSAGPQHVWVVRS